MALVGAGCALALAACTGLPQATLGGALQDRSPAASGRLKSLVWDLPRGEPTTLDYAFAGDYSPYFVVSNLCDTLLRLNPDATESAGIASSWEHPDPRTLVLHLRKDVTFWDGQPLTSADVVYSMKRELDPSAVGNSYYSNVKAIEATDTHTVTVRFTAPDELFLKELATTSGTVVEAAYAQRAGKKFGTAQGGVMCSGPFELAKWNPGTSIELKANPHYWDPAYRAYADKVTLMFVTDTTALTQALASGAIDGAYEVPNTALTTLKGNATGQLYYGPSLATLELIPAQATGPAAQPDIRRALSLVINRTELATTVYRGAATANTTLLPENGWDKTALATYGKAKRALSLPHPTPTAADLDEARTLVAKHRSEIRPISLAIIAGDSDELDAASVIQQAAASVGITITIRQIPALQFSSMFYDPTYRKGVDLILTEGFLDIPDPLDWIPLLVKSNALFNWTGYSDPQVDENLAKAQQTFDPQARAQLITQAQQRWEAQTVDIPLVAFKEVTFMNKRVTGAPTSFSYIFMPSLAPVGSR